ncbi:MAG: DUF2252 domain-containing protein [Thermoleophilia bacterium]|nr:DUF2252 domain-containing protein [Thermoleophilia bacterium]
MAEPGSFPTLDDDRKRGRALRSEIKRSAHGKFHPTQRDPVWIIEQQNESRIQQLVPVRIGRMLQSRFAYYRGTAATMAFDLSKESNTDVNVIICGDAHAANFGLFAAPDRRVLFDLNDFDEAGPGPWEWDVKRLVTSIEVGYRHRGFTPEQAEAACLTAARTYRTRLAELTELSTAERYFKRAEMDDISAMAVDERGRKLIAKTVKKASRRTSEQVLGKIVTTTEDGKPRIQDQPPILQHFEDVMSRDEIQQVYDRYLQTLRPDIALLLSNFELVDYALRVVGVGSVGTRCAILLLIGPQGEPLFIQLKEADKSVLETWGGVPPAPLAGLGGSHEPSNGYRVVSTQQVLQAASDPFLGWIGDVRGFDYYVRQFRDMKGSADLDTLTVTQFENYGAICGALLARAHSQSPGWAAITGYLGNSDSFDRAVASWSKSYADQAERDFEALEQAVKSGRLPAETGV